MADQAEGKQPELGLGPLLSVFSQPEGFQMEPQAYLQGLRRVGLNLRIKPRKRLILEKPEALTLPLEINQVWSMDLCMTSLKTAERLDCSMSLTTTTEKQLARRRTSFCRLRG